MADWLVVDMANPDGTITRTPFPNNIIPASRIDPIARRYMDAFWKPNGPGIDVFHTNNYVVSTPVRTSSVVVPIAASEASADSSAARMLAEVWPKS